MEKRQYNKLHGIWVGTRNRLLFVTIDELRHIDLRGANLHEADLCGVNLREADLRGAYLYRADLRNVNFYEANFRETNLYGADLRGADLRGADLYGADLRGVDLRRADLRRAYLHGADLRGADLRGADLRRAYLHGARLPAGYRFIIKTLYNITVTPHTVIIGCQQMAIADWLGERGQLIAKENNLSAEEIEEYKKVLTALLPTSPVEVMQDGTLVEVRSLNKSEKK